MTHWLHALALLLALGGLVGCIVPALPGVWLSLAGIVACFYAGDTVTGTILAVSIGLCIVATVLDTVAPLLGARKFHVSKCGTWGCFIGTFAGLLCLPWGLLAGPFLGAFLGEIGFAGKSTREALKSGAGALLGFVCGVLVKLACCGWMTVWIVRSAAEAWG